jgi:hypothetical protein
MMSVRRFVLLASRAVLIAAALLAFGLPAAQAGGGHRPRSGHWFDGAHGHRHYYPATGWRVATVPSHVHWVPWYGVRYGYWNGVWYQPYGGAYVVARPPVGIVVAGLPAFATAVTIGGLGYLYANGVYYRDRGDSSYEVVPSPEVVSTANHRGPARSFVYPKLGQSAEKQASDEYECHRWAADQTGFDPSAAAAGQGTGPSQRSDYARAQGACLEGRGYTVR